MERLLRLRAQVSLFGLWLVGSGDRDNGNDREAPLLQWRPDARWVPPRRLSLNRAFPELHRLRRVIALFLVVITVVNVVVGQETPCAGESSSVIYLPIGVFAWHRFDTYAFFNMGVCTVFACPAIWFVFVSKLPICPRVLLAVCLLVPILTCLWLTATILVCKVLGLVMFALCFFATLIVSVIFSSLKCIGLRLIVYNLAVLIALALIVKVIAAPRLLRSLARCRHCASVDFLADMLRMLPPRRLVFWQIWRRWLSMYLMGWSCVSLLLLIGVSVRTMIPLFTVQALGQELTVLFLAAITPQAVLVAVYELAPFELAQKVERAQMLMLCGSFAAVVWILQGLARGWNLSLRRQWEEITVVSLVALMPLFLAFSFLAVAVPCSQQRLKTLELQRLTSAKRHSEIPLCTLCQTSQADALNSPCGHVFLCMQCAKRFQRHEGTVCNVCRQQSSLTRIIPKERRVLLEPSGRPLSSNLWTLMGSLWWSWRQRRWQARLFRTAFCNMCRRQRLANAVNLPCGHCEFCMECAESWRAQHGERCSKCAQLAHVEMTIAEQTCCICFEVATANDIVGVDNCGHQMCSECCLQFVRSALGNVAEEVKPEGLRCPMFAVGCGSFLTPEAIGQHLLYRPAPSSPAQPISLEEVQRLERFVQEARIPVDFRYVCVNGQCARMLSLDLASLLACGETNIQCPFCSMAQCVRCHIPWHGAMSCVEVARLGLDGHHTGQSALDNALITATSKPCPNCGFRISHYHGHACHHIKPGGGCPSCGHHFCYSCLSIGIRCPNNCSLYCGRDVQRYLKIRPFPHDTRCGCPICPDCRPGKQCPQCDGTCCVCQGIVPPGELPPVEQGRQTEKCHVQ